jgi:chemotaxis protein CheD
MNTALTYYDQTFKTNALLVHPGDYFTTRDSQIMVVTLLGSCVSACVRDREQKIGGLNHFLLPEPSGSVITSASNRYGSYAMERLINDILKQGGRRENLEVKLFGGSHLIQNGLNIGQSNIDFIRTYMKTEQIRVVSEDLGGTFARRIHYWPTSGRVMRLMIEQQTKIIQQETNYQQTIKAKEDFGQVELF